VQPETKYAQSPNGAVGYQVFGDGPLDLMFITQWGTNVDNYWDEPSAARYLDRLASFSRVIIFDKLGTGVSDPIPPHLSPSVDLWMQDIDAVMEAADSDKVVMVGDTEGGTMAIQFAAAHPERTHSLVLINAIARLFRGPDYPIGMPADIAERNAEIFFRQHGTTGDVLAFTAPSVAEDARFRRWWVRFQRSTMSPAMLETGYKWQTEVDVTAVLPTITVPTLVVHRKDNWYHRVAFGRYIADNIPGAEWIELEGADSLPFHTGNYQEILDHVERFVTGETAHMTEKRRLATVMFTDIVGSTKRATELGDQRWLDLLGDANQICVTQVERFGGTSIHTTGDGYLAIFDSPASAVTAAREILDQVRTLGVEMRAGLHTGEITLQGDDIAGIGVHIAARVMDQAADGAVAVSSTVKDLTVGSSIVYQPLRTTELKGVPGEWALYQVT
jgi:class 3 adenylate cyclase/pimeloyl-ACP methyl ester carboxylesterase